MHIFLKSLRAVINTKMGFTILAGALVIIFSTWVFFDASKAGVVTAADGVQTDTDSVEGLLNDLGIDIGIYDQLEDDEKTAFLAEMDLHFETEHEIRLTIDEKVNTYHTTAVTVGQFLQEEGLDFTKYDDISHPDIAIIDDEMDIVVNRAFPIVLIDGGKEKDILATKGSVKDLLEKENINYDEMDQIEPGLHAELVEDMEVSITYVEEETEEIMESIPFYVEEEDDSGLEKGKTRVVSEGAEGEKRITYQIILENGEEVGREMIREEIVTEAQNRVVAIGTKQAAASNKGSNGKTFTMVATAYGPDCKGCSGISATGMNLKNAPKVISVDPSVIPLGTRVWVEGYGEAIAADTGGSIKGNRIDVLMESEAAARNQWGRRTVTVKILD